MARKVIVQMHGGTISGVYAEGNEALDVIFLEAPKYSEDPDSETYVKDGYFKDDFIYTRASSESVGQRSMRAVFAAADEYSKE